jgi:endonuclease G, mitochondrial
MRRAIFTTITVLLFVSPAHGKKAKDGHKYKPIHDPPAGYQHDRWKTEPRDHVFEFKAFITSFDGADDGDGDTEENDKIGVPEWVAFEVRKKALKVSTTRPSWMSEQTLNTKTAGLIAPKDASCKFKNSVKVTFPVSLTYNLSRGHMCPKNIANRMGANADHNTHTVLNACPQYQWHNNGIWKN